MSLPTPVKTWQYSLNTLLASTGVAITNNRNLLLAIKNQLKAFASNPWTVRYSCNSVTAGTAGDGVDRWATNADVVGGSAGAAHSWFVFKQAGIATNFQMLLSVSPEGAGAFSPGGNVISVFVSANAGFTGGTATARPTATDEMALIQAGTGSSIWGGSPITTATIRMQAMQSTDGACTRIVLCSSNVAWGIMVFDACTNSVTGWTNPFVAFVGAPSAASFPSPLGTQIATWDTTATASRVFISSTLGIGILTAEGNGSFVAPADTNYGNLANEVDGNWPIYPIGIACSTIGIRGRMGSMIDLWWGSSAIPTGDTYDTSSKTFAQFGNFIVPWDGTTVPIIT